MKKATLFIAGICFAFGANAQTFSDDFESYISGSLLGPQSPDWGTWSGAGGGADDVNVASSDNHTTGGTKSLYFTSTSANGGPSDVVLPFSTAPLTTGQFTFTSWFKIPASKTAYFNFQGTATMGAMYTLDCKMDAAGAITIENSGTPVVTAVQPSGAWFELQITANLNTNNWELLIDGVSKGTWSNANNQVYAIDIYPADAAASFWVDDVSYSTASYTLTPRNLAVLNVAMANGNMGWIKGGLAGQQRTLSGSVRNLGTTTITSFDLEINQNGALTTANFPVVNIASLDFYNFNFPAPTTLLAGANNYTITVKNVNTIAGDDDGSDDSKTALITGVVPAPGKMVIGEEGTGTWCGWCPRGAVGMENMDIFYSGYFQGISVHNGDVMTDVGHDGPFSALISGYPNALVDRGAEVDPSSMETDFLTRIQAAPTAFMKNGATYNTVTRELKVSIQSVFQSAASGSYKIACVIAEDSITGGASTYNQTNYYSSTSQNLPLVGAGHNWQTESAAVSYTKMQYDYVSRLISPSFYGTNQCFTSTMAVNDTFTHTFTFILPAAWKDNYLHIVGILIDPAGKVDNGSSTTIAEAVANGYQTGCEVNTALAALTTTAATTITATSAKSGGTLTSNGGTPILTKGVCWNTTGMPTYADAKTSNGIGTTGYTSSLTGLTNNTLYYVRAFAVNSKDTAYGNQQTFTTLSLVGMNEISNSENVIVVSPVVDAILLYGIKDEIKSIQLIDINGRVMTTYANMTVNDGTLSLPLDNSLPNGMYFLRINNHAYKIMKVTK